MQPFDFLTNYCAILVFSILYLLTFASLMVGSIFFGILFGYSAILVLSIRNDVIQFMTTGVE